MNNIRAICFDLDDTLWDLRPVIPRAEQALYDWLEENYPRVTGRYSPRDVRDIRQAAAERWPELRHDLTELRFRVLRQLAEAAGYDEEMVQGAYDVFYAARNDVSIYSDVAPVLKELSASYPLFALSNGNADLELIGIAHFFAASFSARELGVAKPDSDFFHSAAERCGMVATDMLHIGDHPGNDIVAAKRTGMRAVWLNRNNQEWTEQECRPDHEIASLHELVSLLC